MEVARDNIGTFGGWIAHANTKAALIAVGVALFPRTKPSPSRFGWPTVKEADVEQLRRATADELEEDAWNHAKKLAGIAGTKYAALKVSLWLGVVTLASFVAWTVLASRLQVP